MNNYVQKVEKVSKHFTTHKYTENAPMQILQYSIPSNKYLLSGLIYYHVLNLINQMNWGGKKENEKLQYFFLSKLFRDLSMSTEM